MGARFLAPLSPRKLQSLAVFLMAMFILWESRPPLCFGNHPFTTWQRLILEGLSSGCARCASLAHHHHHYQHYVGYEPLGVVSWRCFSCVLQRLWKESYGFDGCGRVAKRIDTIFWLGRQTHRKNRHMTCHVSGFKAVLFLSDLR